MATWTQAAPVRAVSGPGGRTIPGAWRIRDRWCRSSRKRGSGVALFEDGEIGAIRTDRAHPREAIQRLGDAGTPHAEAPAVDLMRNRHLIGFGPVGRQLGYDAVRRWRRVERVRRSRVDRWLLDPDQSQTKFMGVIFLIRALPFLNMDIASYVVGVTRLSFWRYALANFLGMLPFKFQVVLLDDRLAQSGSHSTLIIMALVAVALLPVVARAAWIW